MHRGTGQDKVTRRLLAAGELKDAYLKEKRVYFISLLDHQPVMADLHSQVNRHERSICYSVLGSVLGPAKVSEPRCSQASTDTHAGFPRMSLSPGKQERSMVSLGDSRNRGKGAHLQFRKTTGWRCENPQQEEHSTMAEQRGLMVGMKAMVVFTRKTGVGSGSHDGGRECSPGSGGSWGTAGGGATK